MPPVNTHAPVVLAALSNPLRISWRKIKMKILCVSELMRNSTFVLFHFLLFSLFREQLFFFHLTSTCIPFPWEEKTTRTSAFALPTYYSDAKKLSTNFCRRKSFKKCVRDFVAWGDKIPLRIYFDFRWFFILDRLRSDLCIVMLSLLHDFPI